MVGIIKLISSILIVIFFYCHTRYTWCSTLVVLKASYVLGKVRMGRNINDILYNNTFIYYQFYIG